MKASLYRTTSVNASSGTMWLRGRASICVGLRATSSILRSLFLLLANNASRPPNNVSFLSVFSLGNLGSARHARLLSASFARLRHDMHGRALAPPPENQLLL
jgi:hypothetical protein